MIKPDDRTTYQREIVSSSGDRILIGGRHIGKTTTVVAESIEQFSQNNRVMVLVNAQRMAQLIGNRIGHHIDADMENGSAYNNNGGEIFIYSLYNTDIDDILGYDVLCVDEANYVQAELLFRIEREFTGDVLLTATPYKQTTPVELWAEHSPYWDSWHVSAYNAPFLDNHEVDEWKEEISLERELREVDGKIQ